MILKKTCLWTILAKRLVRKQMTRKQSTLVFKSLSTHRFPFCFLYFPQKQTKVFMNQPTTITAFWKNRSKLVVKLTRITTNSASPHPQVRSQKSLVNRLGLLAWTIIRHMLCLGRRKTLKSL